MGNEVHAVMQERPAASLFYHPAKRTISLEEFLQDQEDTSTQASSEDQHLETQSSGSSSEDASLDAEQAIGKVLISLTQGLGAWSAGSVGHNAGCCKPCAFVWKEEGCKEGEGCPFCHLCPPDEIKRRKKEKLAWRKVAKT